MTRAKILVVALALIALLLPVAMPWIKTPLILGTAFGIAALGISILIISGQISFGHAMFVCAGGYAVVDPTTDERRDYRSIYDVSGDPTLLDSLISRIAPQGEVVLAGFYSEPLSFTFPPAFMREARIRVAAEWQQPDIAATKDLIETGRLSLDGLITHHHDAKSAPDAYRIAFEDAACLKMVLNWRLS